MTLSLDTVAYLSYDQLKSLSHGQVSVHVRFETPEQIAIAISQGCQEAEAVLLDRYYRTVLFMLKKRLNDDALALDICQETFQVMIEKLRVHQLDQPKKLAAFVQQTAINLAIAENRKVQRRRTSADTDQVEALSMPDDDPVSLIASERAASAVDQLIQEMHNKRDKQLLRLYYIDEWEKDAICQHLDLGYRHFDRVISRARSRFRDLVDKTGQSEHLLGVVR